MTTRSVAVGLLALVSVASLAAEARAQTPSSSAGDRGGVTGVIRGRLQGEVTALPSAMVEVVSGGVRRATFADAAGRYTVPDLPAGDATVSATHLGYASLTLTVAVPAGDFVTLDLELSGRPVSLPPVDVVGDARAADAAVPDGDDAGAPLREIDLQALELGPGVGQSGLADVVGALPGNDPGDATDVLFMRGSTADLKLVLLDGVPVYTPFHVAGLMKTFEQGVLGAADLHVGGAPARFDGGLTHILELRTRAARRDRVRVSGAVDLLSASGAVETPLGRSAGVLLSGRTLHGLGDAPLGGASPYGYRDALVTAAVEPAEGHRLRATGFWNEESVFLDDESTGDARWANRAGSLAYAADLGSARLDVSGGLSAYRAALPLQPSGRPGEVLPPSLLATAATDRVRVVAEATWGERQAPTRAGLSFEHIDERFEARELSGASGASSRGDARALGAFLDATRRLAPGLSLRAGLRADNFADGVVRLAPRAAISWEVGPEALVTVAAGRYHQPTRSTDAQVDRALADLAADSLPPAGRLPVATADHVVVGVDQRLAGTVRLGLQGFWKTYRGLPTANRRAVQSSGIDVRVVTASEDAAAWLGYGLSWFWSSVDLSGSASEFVGRHLLSAGVSGRLIGPIQAEARVAYGAGLPYTSIPFGTPTALTSTSSSATMQSAYADRGEPLVEGLDEAFLRLDLELHALMEPTWGGRAWRVRPYVRILNALDRRDALFYTFQPWRSDALKPLAERPLLPILGVAFSF